MIQSLDFHVNALDVMQKYPEKLFYIGNTQLLEKPKVSIVGTRHPFPSTKIFTHTIANKLSSAGFCIVSGGALGVDAIAHQAAGANNTIMVMSYTTKNLTQQQKT
ncbi:MAG: DNA-processing protein DprA [Candidatus Marinarcus sp.]|uniref:DNA-processing protein DprA n=1 Tax=Candidatus Marinarcus sp. TaxID=3100987 RepID=UPI003B00A8DE